MNMEDHVMQSTDYPSTLLRGLSQLYSRNALVDCRLSFQDGESLLAHKCILAAASKYLKVQIEKGAVSSGVLMIRSVSSVEFGALLHFMYTGELKLNPDSVWDITSAAAILDMPDALKLCREFVEIGGGLVSQEEQTEEEKPELSVQDQAWQGNQLITVRRRGRPKRESKSMAKKLKDQKEFDVVPDVAVKVEVVDENLFNREDNGESSTMNYDEATDGISEECGVDDDDLNDNTYTPPALKKLKKTSKEKSNSPKKNRKKATKLMKPGQNVEAGTSSKKFTSIKVKSKRRGKTDSTKVQMPLVPYPKHECHLCSYKFFHYSSLQLHLRQHKVSPLFLRTLQLCTRKYQKMRFRTDANTTLKTVLYKCRRCCESFAKRVDCVKHINSLCKQTRILTCRLCKRKFSSGRDLMMHRISSHSKLMMDCDVLDPEDGSSLEIETPEEVTSSYYPIKSTPEKDKFNCNTCKKSFTLKHNLNRHLKQHDTKKCLCKSCRKTFNSQKELDNHTSKAHSFLCAECGKQFKTVQSLTIHKNVIHENKYEYTCFVVGCGRKFVRKLLLEAHMNTHMGSKPYECEKCPCRYASKYSLKMHQKICDKSRKFICAVCSSEYRRQSELRDHLKTVHQQQKYLCSCGRSFSWRTGLSRHKKTCK